MPSEGTGGRLVSASERIFFRTGRLLLFALRPSCVFSANFEMAGCGILVTAGYWDGM
jgi:hypothetical protein